MNDIKKLVDNCLKYFFITLFTGLKKRPVNYYNYRVSNGNI